MNSNPAFDCIALPVKNLLAVQTTRINPKDLTQNKGQYGEFNLGLHVGDHPEDVKHNRKIIRSFFPEQCAIQWLDQVHGSEVAVIEKVSMQPITADAAITQNSNLALAVMTADCLPIILACKNGVEIAVIHGGWKPLAKDIIAKTIEQMHTKPSDIVAWLGPCIGQAYFEVGKEVKAAFMKLDKRLANAFRPAYVLETNKYLADLHKIAVIQLENIGINTHFILPHCTIEMNQRYYSYRKERTTGRMATIACLI